MELVGTGTNQVTSRTVTSWTGVAAEHPFGLHTLPYGVFTDAVGSQPRVGVAVGDAILDLTTATRDLLPEHAALFRNGSLDALLAAGRQTWTMVRETLTRWLTDDRHAEALAPLLLPATDVTMQLPFTIADYVDFYSCEQHAANIGRIFRPGQRAVPPNWRHLPVGYHGRAGTVVVSGTPVIRPSCQRRLPEGTVTFGPSTALDFEAEIGFVIGTPSVLGRPVPLTDFAHHVFGLCLLNDWSARDIQSWESVPLGPLLGKSFATSISPWVVPLDALSTARIRPPVRDPYPLPYLDDTITEPWGLDITLEVRLIGQLISRPPFAGMYWTAPQQLAHLTSNGACLRTGDLFASGTVSGAAPDERGCLLELSWNGSAPLTLADGSTRTFLADGDEVSITATASGPEGTSVGLGEVCGRISPALVDRAPRG
ncbi:MAG: fumarylacetoacetase [Pseudonocardiales bacterium]|nr:fumarylacetoacetase [Pseudonocardiales bacterium]